VKEKTWLSALKPLVSAPTQWQAFEQMIDFHVENNRKTLEQSHDTFDIYRAQGAIMALGKLKTLKDEIHAQV